MADGTTDPRYGIQKPEHYYGKYAGLVVDNAAPASGAHRGDVVVTVPGILEETADGSGSQPLQVTASPSFLPGFFFVPNQGDAVWVEFVDGDINYPIWTGVWYPPGDTPQTVAAAAPTLDQRVIRTRSGQVIQFDDTDGSEQLVIKDEKNKASITFDKNGITITSDTGIALICGQSSLKLSDQQIVLSRPAVTLTVASTVDVS